jgi:hypothetical protein
MGVQFVGKKGSPVIVTLAVTANDGGPAKATYVWQNISNPKNPAQIHSDDNPVWSSQVTLSANDLGNAPLGIYSMLVSLLPTADAQVWAWAIQDGAFLTAVDDGGNPIPPQGPHQAVQVGPTTKGQTAHESVSVAVS